MEYRLNKFISNSGYCSRREADKLIEEGKVKINGRTAKLGDKVFPKQEVTVEGHIIMHDIDPIYIAFNKPVGIVSTTDPTEKANIIDYICHEERIFPIGRLDKDSQGLILLTNDGDIVNKILRVGNNHEKTYLVTVDRPITEDFINKMENGVPILDRVTRKCRIKQINPHTFEIALTQGLNRQIRRMCAYFDYEVLKLERTQIMNIKLGKIGLGTYRDLTPHELEVLFELLEESDNSAKVRSGANSNKKMNQQLKLLDIQSDYRKSGLNAQNRASTTKKPKASKPKFTPNKGEEGAIPFKHKKKSTGTGPRIGKSRPSKFKKNHR